MAPEQASGRAYEVGPAADVYALGAILYDCLAGRPPFRGETVVETLDLVRTQDPVPPSRIQPRVPFDLETVCLKAMAKDPARRYPSAGELAADLRRFLDDEPVLARRVGAAERAWRRARKNPALVVLTALVLTLGAAVVVAVTRPRPGPPAPAAVSPPVEADSSADDLLGVVAELDRTDPGWRLEQIEANRPAVPDDQNGALRVLTFRDIVSDLSGQPRSFAASATWQSEGLKARLEALQTLPPTARLTEADAADFRAELTRVGPALAQARKLADYPRGRFPIAHRRDAVSTLLPHTSQARQLVHLLYLDALLHAQDGDRPAALRACLAMAHAANALRDEPLMISQLVRMRLLRTAVQALEHCAARGPCAGEELAALQGVLADAAADPVLLTVARGERAMLHDAFGSLEAGDLPVAEFLRMLGQEGHPPSPGPREVRLLHAWLLRYHTRIVEVTRLPADQYLDRLAALDAEVKSAPSAGGLALAGLV